LTPKFHFQLIDNSEYIWWEPLHAGELLHIEIPLGKKSQCEKPDSTGLQRSKSVCDKKQDTQNPV
jgi:hypothetical protein